MPLRPETGSLVEVRGERWLLIKAEAFESCSLLTLEGRDPANVNERLRVIHPFDRPRPLARGTLTRRSRHRVLQAAWTAMAAARPVTGLWTAANAAIDLWPYQIEPALAVIGGATRLLLADAVGLGKTIQAGLILAELRERGWIERALIVCPAGLRDTWARELRDRFRITAFVLDQVSIAERIASLPPGVNPWSGHPVAIVSIDFVKRPEVLAALDGQAIDLVIADEAHHLAPGTDRGAAVSHLASRVPWCVLVSATPHSGDTSAFNYLTGIGDCGEALTVFRRRRADVGLATMRRSRFVGVTPTLEESALLMAVDRYARAIWQARGRIDSAVRLVAITLSRRAASSPSALERTLVRRLALLDAEPIEPAQACLPWEDYDDADDAGGDSLLSLAGLDNLDHERRVLAELIALAGRCRVSAKIQRLRRFISRTTEPAIIFTEYRDTLEAVVMSLAPLRRVAAIHGGLTTDLRRRTVDAFNDGRIDVLAATDAAGEGLNLHHRCRLVIDMELPWNPLRLEQRVGRVDRLGQRRTVHAVHLFHPGTVEQRVLDHLQLRRRRADAVLDGVSATEIAVAGAVFENTPLAETIQVFIRGDRIDSAATEVRRLEHQRRVLRSGTQGEVEASWAPPGTLRPGRLLLLHRLALINARGLLIGHEFAARRVTLPAAPRNRRDWRLAIRCAHLGAVRDAILADIEPGLAAAIEGVTRGREGVARRIAVIRRRLAARASVELQSSLFDQRAELDLELRRLEAAQLDKALLDLQGRVDGAPRPGGSRLELVAAWPEHRR